MHQAIKAHPRYAFAVVIVNAFALGAVGISFSHIVELGTTLGLSASAAFTAPFFIDGIAGLGKLGMSDRFARSTQRAGLMLVAIGGSASLAANIPSGDNPGERIYGRMVVGGFVLAEWYAGKLKPAPKPVVVDDELTAKRRAAAVKGAETRKANAAKAKRRPRAPKPAEVAALEAAYAMPDAPVTPAYHEAVPLCSWGCSYLDGRVGDRRCRGAAYITVWWRPAALATLVGSGRARRRLRLGPGRGLGRVRRAPAARPRATGAGEILTSGCDLHQPCPRS